MYEPSSAADGELALQVTVQPAISYALVHNGSRLVREITVHNQSNKLVPLGTLSVELLGPSGPMTGSWSADLTDLAPNQRVSWEDFPTFTPELAQLRDADEAFPATYVVTLRRPWQADLRLTVPALVLAHNEWFNTPGLFDSLAAFVRPNTAAVSRILQSTSEILLRHTGSGSVQGYQAGPARAAQIAGAVYESLRAQRISYHELPASFEETGQKLRTAAEVLDGRLGNCLDLSVTYAACLEAAGLRPLIWLTDRHAFGGFLVDDGRLETSTVTEPNLLAAMVDAGEAVPIELTGLGPGDGNLSFAAAVAAGLGHFLDDQLALRGAVDVHLAHRSGVRPLPSPGEPVLVDAATEPCPQVDKVSIALPDGNAKARIARHDADGELFEDADDVPERVRRWQRRLLDLSLRNPLLNLPRRGGLDLYLPPGGLAVLDDQIHAGRPVSLVPIDTVSDTQALAGATGAQDLPEDAVLDELRRDRRAYVHVGQERYVAELRKLQRAARTLEQETGSNYLYLTLGALKHPRPSGGDALAPLFVLPVRIDGGTGHRPYRIVIDGNEIASTNHCLVEWLRVRHGVRIPELEQPPRDDFGIDIEAALTDVSASLVEHRLDYRVVPTASLRLLQFGTFQMWRDLRDNWRAFLQNPVVRHLVESAGSTFDDPVGPPPELDEGELTLPIPADGSQLTAVAHAVSGRSFVLEGPPGTGKSQTITNLIAAAMQAGKTVLFVAEKQAALDVVKRRLDAVGLGPLALDLHGRKQSMSAIRDQLKSAMSVATRTDAAWDTVAAAYRTALGPLADYSRQLHEPNAAGDSMWSAYEQLLGAFDGIEAAIAVEHLGVSAQCRDEVTEALRAFPHAARSARLRPDHPWTISGLRDVSEVDVASLRAAADALGTLRRAVEDAPANLTTLLGHLSGPADLAVVLPVAALAAAGSLPDEPTLRTAETPGWDDHYHAVASSLSQFRAAHHMVLEMWRPELLIDPRLQGWQARAAAAGSRTFGKMKHWRVIAAELRPLLAPGVEMAPEQVERHLTAARYTTDAASAVLARVRALGGLRLAPDWLPTAPDAEQRLAQAYDVTTVCRELRVRLPKTWNLVAGGVDRMAVSFLTDVDAAWRRWLDLLHTTDTELRDWIGEAGWYQRWQQIGDAWVKDLATTGVLGLQRWGQLRTRLDVLAAAGLGEFAEQLRTGTVPADAAELAYLRGRATTSLMERRGASELAYFDAELHEHRIAEYLQARRRIQDQLPTQAPAMVVQRRPFAPTSRRGRAGELAAQLARKRGGLSFRELFSNYSDLLTALAPCFLMSPSTVATFLDPRVAKFDLVVFDEASQIRVPEAIGSMGRARSAVIVGDSQQMPPTSVMRVTEQVEEDSVQAPDDLESILGEAVESGLQPVRLSWHYRSQDEALIAFSNRYYYDNELSSLPSPGNDEQAVVWRRIDGSYDRGRSRTNAVEASAVVAEIRQRVHAGDHSIGVVTFNIQQRDLILDLLEDSGDPTIIELLARTDGESLFVKNLENVQGDERDVVFFSLAFAKDPDTGRLPLNFGPLIRSGGERRLNVAITRARRQVVLFSSFDPMDLDVSRSTSIGLQHLRAYCEMAANGRASLGDLATAGRGTHRVIVEIAEALEAHGLSVTTDLGLSDFTVDIAVRSPKSPNWQVALLLDTPAWASRPTVADQYASTSLLTDVMHWPSALRVWLPDWLQDKQNVVEAVREAVDEAEEQRLERERRDHERLEQERLEHHQLEPEQRQLEQLAEEPLASQRVERERPADEPPEHDQLGNERPAARTLPAELATPTEHEPVEPPSEWPPFAASSETAVARSGSSLSPVLRVASIQPAATDDRLVSTGPEPHPFIPYVAAAAIGDRSDLDVIETSPRVQQLARDVLHDVVEAEWPVEQQRLARLALGRFGLDRTRQDRRDAILALVEPSCLHQERDGQSFCWPVGYDIDAWREFRVTTSSNDRRFGEISLYELANALRHVARTGRIADEPVLLRATLEELGIRRMTVGIEHRLRTALAFALDTGRLLRNTTAHFVSGT